MDKVWVVTSGEYSDYRIAAVFASEEEADSFVRWKNGPFGTKYTSYGDEHRVEEYELGAPTPSPRTGAYCATMYVGSPREPGVIWDPHADPNTPTEGTVERHSGKTRATAYGASPVRARLRARLFARAVLAGTIVLEDPYREERARHRREERARHRREIMAGAAEIEKLLP